MNTSRNNIIFTLVMFVLFGSYFYYKYANKKHDNNTENAAQTTDKKENASPSVDTKAYVDKINQYIDCIGRNAGRVRQSEKRYYSWCAKTGPTGKERNIYGLYTIYGTASYCDDSEKWADTKPELPKLEMAVKQYIIALNLLDNFLKQVDRYYDQGDYKDDDMAKGKVFHSQLQENFEQFYAAESLFKQAIEEEKQKVKGLKPLPVEPLYKAVQVLVDALQTQTEYSPVMLERINALDEEIIKVKLDDTEFAKENSSFFYDLDAFLRNAKEYVRHFREDKNNKNMSPENREMYQKMLQTQLLEGQSRLAAAYNRIRSNQPFIKEFAY